VLVADDPETLASYRILEMIYKTRVVLFIINVIYKILELPKLNSNEPKLVKTKDNIHRIRLATFDSDPDIGLLLF